MDLRTFFRILLTTGATNCRIGDEHFLLKKEAERLHEDEYPHEVENAKCFNDLLFSKFVVGQKFG